MITALWNAPLAQYQMGPLEILDFGISWASWLQPNELIIGEPSIVQTDGDGLLTINPGQNMTVVNAGVVVWWLATPTISQTYTLHVTVTTNQGRTSTRHIAISGVPR